MNSSFSLRIGRQASYLLCGLILTSCTAEPSKQVPVASAPLTSGASPLFEGYHDFANCHAIMGWVWNQAAPDEVFKVEIYDGNSLLTTLTADEFRPDLLKEKKGNGKHSFLYLVPPALKDNKPHKIIVKIAGTNYDLANTPKEFICAPSEPTPGKP